MQPWRLLADPSGYIFTWLVGYSGGLGSIAGVLIADYWIVRRRELRLEDLYLPRTASLSGGWNWRAVVATLAGCALAWGGLVVPALKPLYDYAWFVGFAVAFTIYALTSGPALRVQPRSAFGWWLPFLGIAAASALHPRLAGAQTLQEGPLSMQRASRSSSPARTRWAASPRSCCAATTAAMRVSGFSLAAHRSGWKPLLLLCSVCTADPRNRRGPGAGEIGGERGRALRTEPVQPTHRDLPEPSVHRPGSANSNPSIPPGCPTVPGTTDYPEKLPPECRPPVPTKKSGPPMAVPMVEPNVPSPAPLPREPSRLAPPSARNKWAREDGKMVYTDSLGRRWAFNPLYDDGATGRWKLDTANKRVVGRPNQLWDALARYDLILTEPGSIPRDQWIFGKLLNP